MIEAWGLGFRLGNAVKYLARAGRKGGPAQRLEDLKKARWYLDREIAAEEAGQARTCKASLQVAERLKALADRPAEEAPKPGSDW